MGASDFALSTYSYHDLERGSSDPKLERFSVDRDRKDILPLLKRILEINPKVQVMATPWSPPAWMKTTGSLIKGQLKTEAYPALAQYFVKFIQAYQREGVPIAAITIQNEPQFEPDGYPGMRMEAIDQANFIADHLGPAFEAAGIDTKILIWDHNWDEIEYPLEVLKILKLTPAEDWVSGTAFHCYKGSVEAQSIVHEAFPNKGIYFTECSGGEWQPNFAANLKWDLENLIIGATRHWARTVIKWNLALDERFGPQNSGCPNCRGVITINQQTGAVKLEPEFYTLGHASKFVQPGARRIASNTDQDGLKTVAFKNANGQKALIVFNSALEVRRFTVVDKDRRFSASIPAGSAATFVYRY